MHKYKQIEYKAGATVEVIKCIPRGSRKGIPRGPSRKKTPEEIRQANMKQAARKLARKINANFRPGDLHMILTYKKDNRPDARAAKKQIKAFLDKMRSQYKRRGFVFKYILVTEHENKAIHHHLIINDINDGEDTTMTLSRKLWKTLGRIKTVPLYEEGEYQGLADYLIKETEKTFRKKDASFKQRYSCSRNLIDPPPKHRMVKAKYWLPDPRPRPGYYIPPQYVYNGFDKLGYPYQRYVMVKINPTDADWEYNANWPEGGTPDG